VCLLLGLGHDAPAGLTQDVTVPTQATEQLPIPNVHPLPLPLAQWHDAADQGDYFAEIRPTPIGYLIWSKFPVTVFVEPVEPAVPPASIQRAQAWVDAVTQAVQEWNAYLPFQVVNRTDTADIAIWRSAPPLQLSRSAQGSAPARPQLGRVRSAETRYELYVDRPTNAPARIAHRFTVQLTPTQTIEYIKATARHELGHALGIWGHSSVETDALYFSQVREPPPISARDINTLKRIYQQPTRVGWDVLPALAP
jgi:predicted Zn-dependent protease